MAASSLWNMNVPTAAGGDTGGSAEGLLMPKLKYRYRVLFSGFGVGAQQTQLTRQVISAARPQVQFQEINIPIYNSTIYLAGKPQWQATQIVVRDDVNNQIQTLVGAQIQKQMDFQEQASAAAGIDYKFTTTIQILDGGNGAGNHGPQVLEEWGLYGCYLADVNYGDLNYGTNEVVTVTMSIRYDNATQTGGPSNFATGVGQVVRAGTGSIVTGTASTASG